MERPRNQHHEKDANMRGKNPLLCRRTSSFFHTPERRTNGQRLKTFQDNGVRNGRNAHIVSAKV